jgi:rubrerythrin
MNQDGRPLSTSAPTATLEAPVDGDQRSAFLKRALVVGGAALAGGALAGAPRLVNAQGGNDDVAALNVALLVEYTEAAFYDQALAAGALKGEVRNFAEQVAAQESEHLAFLKNALGDKADPKPKFDFGDRVRDQDRFAQSAAELEDLAVATYNGQATNISKETLAAAAKIVSVEARHAAWIRSIVGEPPAPDATDTPKSAGEVLDGLTALGLQR